MGEDQEFLTRHLKETSSKQDMWIFSGEAKFGKERKLGS